MPSPRNRRTWRHGWTSKPPSRRNVSNGARRAGQVATLTTVVVLTASIWLAWPGLSKPSCRAKVHRSPCLVYRPWCCCAAPRCTTTPADRPKPAGRAAAAAAIAWPSLLFLGLRTSDAGVEERLAAGVVLVLIGVLLYRTAADAFAGGFRQARYRALLTAAGAVTVASLWFGLRTDVGADNDLAGAGMTVLACGVALRSWFVEDEQRALRKRFKSRLDALEHRLLDLKAQGRRVDQATSLGAHRGRGRIQRSRARHAFAR